MRKPGFMLNLHSREKNPCFESHDPGMMYDPVSGYCYSYSTDGGITTPYCQGIQIRRSKDMVDFEYVGMALSEAAIAEGRDNGKFLLLPGYNLCRPRLLSPFIIRSPDRDYQRSASG